MTSPYTALTPDEQNAHIIMASTVGYSGIYPSGTAHFFDSSSQNTTDILPTTNYSNTSIFEFTNLDSRFSNATESYVIDDFTVFNLYRHNNLQYTLNISNLLRASTQLLNIYSPSFRTWV